MQVSKCCLSKDLLFCHIKTRSEPISFQRDQYAIGMPCLKLNSNSTNFKYIIVQQILCMTIVMALSKLIPLSVQYKSLWNPTTYSKPTEVQLITYQKYIRLRNAKLSQYLAGLSPIRFRQKMLKKERKKRLRRVCACVFVCEYWLLVI